MKYSRISADCHIDLCLVQTDLFTSEATPAMKDRIPCIADGSYWTSKNGIFLGLKNEVGPAGVEHFVCLPG